MPRIQIEPRDLCTSAALVAAGKTAMCKKRGEYDTEFVKRIVCAYFNALPEVREMDKRIAAALTGRS